MIILWGFFVVHLLYFLPMLNWDGYMGTLQSIKKEYFVTFVTFKHIKNS